MVCGKPLYFFKITVVSLHFHCLSAVCICSVPSNNPRIIFGCSICFDIAIETINNIVSRRDFGKMHLCVEMLFFSSVITAYPKGKPT